jgi:hypothetical protein
MDYQISYDPHPISTLLRERRIIDGPHRILTTGQIDIIDINPVNPLEEIIIQILSNPLER